MKPMPLLLAASAPLLGPLVPVKPEAKKVLTEGLEFGGQVVVYGHNKEGIRAGTVVQIDIDGAVEVSIQCYAYLQAERLGRGRPVHVWVE